MADAHEDAPPRLLALELIDEPEVPVRESMNHVGLVELADSIRDMGLLQPIGVCPNGDRFEVIFGHRRLLAARIARLESIPVRVYSCDGARKAALQIHENADREAVNPAEEGRHYAWLLEHFCEGDVDRLYELVKKRPTYIEPRLAIALGDEQVCQAVMAGQITQGVALELNLEEDASDRKLHLDAAINGGATARVVRSWRLEREAVRRLTRGGEETPSTYAPPPAQPAGSSLVCCICQGNTDTWEMDHLYVHRTCRSRFLDRALERIQTPSGPHQAERKI